MKTDNRQHIYFVIGAAILLIGLYNGLRYAMPIDVVNPYEYFHGSERTNFQLVNIFIGGAVVPLISIAAGALLMTFRESRPVNVILTLIVMLFFIMVSTVFFFGFDVLPGIIIMLLAAALFMKLDNKIILASFGFLFALHLVFNGFIFLWGGSGPPGDIIYSSIQQVNRFSSVFGGSDYFAIIGLNLEVFMTYQLGSGFRWTLTILPWIFLGMVLQQSDIRGLTRTHTGMMIAVAAALTIGGLMIKMIEILSVGSFAATGLATYFGGPLLGAGYFMGLLLISMHVPEKVRAVLTAAGTKGLTVYVAFNFVMMLLFYGPGLGLFGEVSIMTTVFTVIVVYAALIVTAAVLERYDIKTLEQLSVVNIGK
ncbi:DUF418 domain-containing protein [Lacicoccus alkaliphilus]|uniref:Uncharacterized membrane protein YeiB n=1 Tax=Lacicoccus alkaliphilus DSM 16010 TaxID=1123231 RepID=A0A1M7FME2_9BACL|nr:DUF418 domain-containing protein [Salinicoccus alkaliphilus]SHM05186.1 Uncharacterized membrane protein YeiB [Salinicoccus alkaliphilus DSM 16010]